MIIIRKSKSTTPESTAKKNRNPGKIIGFSVFAFFSKKKCLDVQHLKLLNSNPLFLQRQLGVGPALQGLRVSVGKICKLAPATPENTCEKLANIRETNANPKWRRAKKIQILRVWGRPDLAVSHCEMTWNTWNSWNHWNYWRVETPEIFQETELPGCLILLGLQARKFLVVFYVFMLLCVYSDSDVLMLRLNALHEDCSDGKCNARL